MVELNGNQTVSNTTSNNYSNKADLEPVRDLVKSKTDDLSLLVFSLDVNS